MVMYCNDLYCTVWYENSELYEVNYLVVCPCDILCEAAVAADAICLAPFICCVVNQRHSIQRSPVNRDVAPPSSISDACHPSPALIHR